MELNDIKQHWDNLAKEYAEDLKSTTKTPTIKHLEINAIMHAIKSVAGEGDKLDILEVGCGNGYNLSGLSGFFKGYDFTGVDYSRQMIENALKIKSRQGMGNVDFLEGDVLKLESNAGLKESYDIVFTNRCLINLNTAHLQHKGFEQLCKKTRKNGHIILVENIIQTYSNQNECREAVGLSARTPDQYNLFIDEDKLMDFAVNELKLELIDTNDFASLHDIILYVLLPKINDGKVDYSHPIMNAVTELLTSVEPHFKNSFGSFGQNRLYLFRKAE